MTGRPSRAAMLAADQRIADRLCTIMRDRGIADQQIADRIGVSCHQVLKYRRGINRISGGRLSTIAEALGISCALLLGEPDPARTLDHARRIDALARSRSPDLVERLAQLRAETKGLLDHLQRADP